MNILFIYSNLNEISEIEGPLSSSGHRIFTAPSYQNALDVLTRVKIDLIVCDLISEKIDGIQILRRLKNSELYSKIPFIIASSSLKDEEDITFFKKLGAQGIIEKPLNLKGIQNVIALNTTAQTLHFEKSEPLSDEEFIDAYSNILTRRIQKRVKELEADQIFINNLINSIPSAIFLIDKDFKIVDLNEAGMRYLGLTDRNEVKGRSCYNLIYKSNKVCNFEGHRCPIIGVIQEKNSTEHYLTIEYQGVKRYLNVHFAPVVNPEDNSILMLEHITDHTGTIDILNKNRENEFKLETILNETRFGIILIEDKTILNINQSAKELLRLKEDTFKGLIDVMGKELYQEIREKVEQNIIFREQVLVHHGDEEKVLQIEAQKIEALNRSFLFILIYDYTENYRLLNNIRDNELLLRTILNNVQDIFILLHNNKIIEANRQIEAITDKKRELLIKQDIFSVLPFISESHLVDIEPKEINARLYDGRNITLLMKIFKLQIKGEAHILLQFTDITSERERKRAEEAQRERIKYLDKLDLVAKMNKGISNNINNLLAGINTYAEYLTKVETDRQRVRATANIIKKLAMNAADTLLKISNLVNKEIEEFNIIDLQEVLDELIYIIKYSSPKNIEFNFDLHSKENTIKGNYFRLLQSLLNIVINAIEAMPEGGRLSISTSNILSDTGQKMIQIKISDTGRGIPEEIRENIFTPYYSSKSAPSAGLGLSVAYNTIISHKGTINYESVIGTGTTFYINLPLCEEPIEEVNKRSYGSQEKILIISENSLEREIIKRVLIRHNYNAYTAVDSFDALESIKISPPSLIILDSNLTRLSQIDTFERIRELLPDVEVILYTGLIFDEATINLILKGIRSILYKPLDIKELLSQVQSALKKTDEEDKKLQRSEKSPTRILIVDDEEYILSALKMNLSDQFIIDIEGSSPNALERLLNSEPYDYYIIDINMPDINGIEFYKRLKELYPDIGKKVILITGGLTEEDLINQLNAIRDEVKILEKPFDIEELIKLLSQ